MPPDLGCNGLSTIIVTCGTEKALHATQPVARVIGYPLSADSFGDFQKLSAGEPFPMPVTDCDTKTRPALAFGNGDTVFAYRSSSGILRVDFGTSERVPRWSDEASLTDYPINDRPSLTVFKTTVYVTYLGREGLAVIQSSTDGKNWSSATDVWSRLCMGPRSAPVRAVNGFILCMCSRSGRGFTMSAVPTAFIGAIPPRIQMNRLQPHQP